MVWDRMAEDRAPAPRGGASGGGDRAPAAEPGGRADDGFRLAAEQLVESVRRDRDRDSLSCSVAFLWRQHVEVRLRQLIVLGDFVVNDRYGTAPPAQPLEALWPEVRQVLARLRLQEADGLDAVDPAIRELMAAAPASPRPPGASADGDVPDLAAFHAAMSRLAAFLDEAAARLDRLSQWKLDALSWIE